MRWVDAARARLRLLLFGEEVEQRMDEEFRFHLDMDTERLVREAGVDPREARRRARAHFGSVEAQKDAVRDARSGWAWLSGLQLGRDVRDGVRSLARRPAFTAVAVLSLALGIGANTAIFSLVNAVILRDSPIERPQEVVNLYLHQAAFEFGSLSYPDFEDVRDGTAEVFSAIAASHFVPLTIERGEGGGVGLAPAEAVTGSYFPMLGIEAAVGRTLLPSDDVSRGGHPVVMLDHRYWQSAFAGDPHVVGREMRVGGRAYTVLPLTDVLLFPPMDAFIRAAAWLLMVVVGLVLLLACTNLASFLLARALDRRKEVAVRLALGVSRGSLVRRFLTETTLLSLLAGGAGVGLAVWLLDLLVTADLPLPAPVTLDLRLDGNVLGFTFGVSVVAGALLGLVPALQSTRPDVAGAPTASSATASPAGRARSASGRRSAPTAPASCGYSSRVASSWWSSVARSGWRSPSSRPAC